MKKNPCPDPRKQPVFSPKRPVAVLLVITVTLCFAFLFTSRGQTSAKAYNTLENVATSTPPPALSVTITSPANGSVYTLPTQIPFTVGLSNLVVANGEDLFYVIGFSATLLPNGPLFPIGSLTQATPGIYTITWVPPQAGTYSVVATASFSSSAGEQSGTSTPITVQVHAPQISCTVGYQVESQWSGGFNVNVVLTNISSVPMNGWTLAFTFLGDQKITQLWNGSFVQMGEQVSITNLSYNGTIMPGGTVNLGFNGAWINNESSPTAFTLNGHSCSTT